MTTFVVIYFCLRAPFIRVKFIRLNRLSLEFKPYRPFIGCVDSLPSSPNIHTVYCDIEVDYGASKIVFSCDYLTISADAADTFVEAYTVEGAFRLLHDDSVVAEMVGVGSV